MKSNAMDTKGVTRKHPHMVKKEDALNAVTALVRVGYPRRPWTVVRVTAWGVIFLTWADEKFFQPRYVTVNESWEIHIETIQKRIQSAAARPRREGEVE